MHGLLDGLIYSFFVILALLSVVIVPAILLLVAFRYLSQREINKILAKKNLR